VIDATRAGTDTGIPTHTEQLFQKAGVACRTSPVAVGEDPNIGEAADMVIGFTQECTFGVIGARHDCRVTVEIYSHVSISHDAGFELGVS